jgi:replicative DNA helicase
MATSDRPARPKAATAANLDLFDRLPPHNAEAEAGVVGAILLNPLVCDEVATILRPEDFYSNANRKLFENMMEMHSAGRSIDLTLLVEQLRRSGDFEEIGGESYLAELMGSVQVTAHAMHYAEIVRDKAVLRELIQTSSSILHDSYDPELQPRDLISKAEERIFAINDSRNNNQCCSMHEVLIDTFKAIDARLEHGAADGVLSGFSKIDEMTGGLHGSELVILAARPSMGKTAFALNIADHVAVDQAKPTLLVSLEMSKMELAQRMLCARGKIDGSKLRSGYMAGSERQSLVKASAELGKAPLFIDDSPSRTVTEIGAVARRLKRSEDLGLIVIDYIGLIEPENPLDSRQEQVAKMARRLKGLARELEVPILTLAQLNRQTEAAKDNRPSLSHLRESGAIEQDADVVMFVHREEYYHSPEEAEDLGIVGQAKIIIAKQRNGPIGDVKLYWMKQYTKFAEYTEQDEYDEFTEFQSPDEF